MCVGSTIGDIALMGPNVVSSTDVRTVGAVHTPPRFAENEVSSTRVRTMARDQTTMATAVTTNRVRTNMKRKKKGRQRPTTEVAV